MGFTVCLAITYLVLLVIDIFAFLRGKESNKWKCFIILTTIMVVGIAVIFYLWITSPM